MACGIGAPREEKPIGRLSRDLKTPNLICSCLRQPSENGSSLVGADELLGDPEALRWLLCIQPNQLLRIEAKLAKARCVNRLGRTDEGHLTVPITHAFQSRSNQAKLGTGRLRA